MEKQPKEAGRTAETRSHEEVEATIEREVDRGVKVEVIDIYEDILTTIWEKIAPTLGNITVRTIAERAVLLASERHPLLKSVAVTDEGFDFKELKTRVDEKGRANIREGFKEIIANLFDILAKLTGNIMVDRLLKEVEGLKDLRSERAA